MAVFKCKICGGTLEILANSTVVECEYCGIKQTLPRLSDDRISNLYDRANHFRRNNDYDKALSIYEQILSEDRSDAEVYWSILLCRYGVEYVDDPVTHKRIPTVHRTQFASILSDDDYKSALLYADDVQKELYEEDAKAIDKIQKGILDVSQKEEPFDVFICYKETDNNGKRTTDSVLATELYQELTREGFKVFFSRITLEDKLGQEYEPYIFAALNSAKVMVVLGTKPEHFNAVWVKNEWRRYLTLINNGARKILIPAYKDMDPYDLPEEFSHLQAQDMAKLGFMQDLTHAIKKILKEDKTTVEKESDVASNNSIEATIDYAILLIEDGEIAKAKSLLDQVVSIAPKHPMIYVGRLLIECGVKRQEDLPKLLDSFENSSNYQKAIRFANPQLKAILEEYLKTTKNNKVKSIYNEALVKLESASSENEFVLAKKMFDSIPDYAKAKEMSAFCLEKADIAKKEAIYQNATKLMYANGSNKINDLQKAIDYYSSIKEYKDSETQIDKCERMMYSEKETIEKRKKKAKKNILITFSLISFILVIVVVYMFLIVPKNNYSNAEELFAQSNYEDAYHLYASLGDYQDSREKAKECIYKQANELRNEGKFDDANLLFEQIKDYKDSIDLIHNHTYEIIDSKKVTCEQDGYKDYKCSSCGKEYRDELKTAGHTYSSATCTEARKCSVCGNVDGNPLGHTTSGTKCSRCGTVTFETISFSGKGSTTKDNISLPNGKFKITCTMTSGDSNVTMYLNYGSSASAYGMQEEMIFNDYVAGTTEVTVVSGPIENGTLVINANSMWSNAKMGWKVTIEAI